MLGIELRQARALTIVLPFWTPLALYSLPESSPSTPKPYETDGVQGKLLPLRELEQNPRVGGRASLIPPFSSMQAPWNHGPGALGRRAPSAMTTGDCCHLPGSLCDCNNGGPAFSKVVEASGLGPPQYVAQVTSRDGRLLSTVIRALDTTRWVVLECVSVDPPPYCSLSLSPPPREPLPGFGPGTMWGCSTGTPGFSLACDSLELCQGLL